MTLLTLAGPNDDENDHYSTEVKRKHAMFELFRCVTLDLFALFSCVGTETVLSVAASIQENTLCYQSKSITIGKSEL